MRSILLRLLGAAAAALVLSSGAPALAQTEPEHHHPAPPTAPAPNPPAPPAGQPMEGHDMGSMPGMEHKDQPGDMAGMPGMHGQHEMHALLGSYAMTRESSGTSWQPESAPHQGFHFLSGPWMGMLHGAATLVYDDQGGRRGDR